MKAKTKQALSVLAAALVAAYPLCHAFDVWDMEAAGSLQIKLVNFVLIFTRRSVSPWVQLLCVLALAVAARYAFDDEASWSLGRGRRVALWTLCGAFGLLGSLAVSVSVRGDLSLFTHNAVTLCRTLTQAAGYAVLYQIALRAALRWLSRTPLRPLSPSGAPVPDEGGRVSRFLLDTRPFLIPFLFVWLCYLPYYLWSFPGGIGWDTVVQLEQFFGWQPYTMRTALPNTVFYGLCYQAGLALGSQRFAVGAVNLAQTLIVAFGAGYAMSTLARLRASRPLRLAALLFWALLPAFPSCAVFANKDAPFLGVFLVFVSQLLRLSDDPAAYARSGRRQLLLALSCLAVLCTRVNGVLCVAPCVAACALALALRRRPMGLSRAAFARVAAVGLAAPLTLSLCLNGLVYPALGVEKNPTGDNVLAPLYVQTAQFYQACPEDVTPAERAVLLALWDEETLQTAPLWLVDQIREGVRYDRGATRADYLRVWAAQAARRPDLCLLAYLKLDGDYFNPRAYTHMMFGVDGQRAFLNAEEVNGGAYDASRTLFNRVRIWWSQDAAPCAVGGVVAYALLGTLALALLGFWRKRRLLALGPSLGVALSVLLAPTFSLRYALPMLAALPLLCSAWENRPRGAQAQTDK